MTGSLLQRQHSSIATYSNSNQVIRPQLRRCSSAEDNNVIGITSKNKGSEKIGFIQCDNATSDNDSGIEDLDQQVASVDHAQSEHVDHKESSLSFGACENERSDIILRSNISEPTNYEQQYSNLNCDDFTLALKVPDREKKHFCTNTREIFHGEFSLWISCPLAFHHPNINYRLFAESEVIGDPRMWAGFYCVKLDNAKAQFKCPNPSCQRSWTSMRARISFTVSRPMPYGFVVLKIYGQTCQTCETSADALWYPEEVCRVMRNLSQSIFACFFPHIPHYFNLQFIEPVQNFNTHAQGSRHDPSQRQGKMRAPHDKYHCEACLHGYCYG